MPSTKTTKSSTKTVAKPKEAPVKETKKATTKSAPVKETPKEPVKEAPKTKSTKKVSSPTVQELKDQLKEQGISFPSKATKTQLLALKNGETLEEPKKKSSKKAKGDGIKRPTSDYIFFSNEKRKSIQQANPQMKQTEIAKKLGALWKTLSDDDKKPYREMAAKDKERYLREKAALESSKPSKDEDDSVDSPKSSNDSDEDTEDLDEE